jgi:hypothetical protein
MRTSFSLIPTLRHEMYSRLPQTCFGGYLMVPLKPRTLNFIYLRFFKWPFFTVIVDLSCFMLPLHSHRRFAVSAFDGVDNLNNSVPTAHAPIRRLTLRLVTLPSEHHSSWTDPAVKAFRSFETMRRSSIREDFNLEHT